LASNGVTVVLTARDEKRGVEAVEKLKHLAHPASVFFHQLDVTDPKSITSLADFIRNQYGKLGILVRKIFWLLFGCNINMLFMFLLQVSHVTL